MLCRHLVKPRLCRLLLESFYLFGFFTENLFERRFRIAPRRALR